MKGIAIAAGGIAAAFMLLVGFAAASPDQSAAAAATVVEACPSVAVRSTPPTTIAGYTGPQLTNAAKIIAAGAALKLGARDQTIGVMTAMGESGLQELAYGDVAGPDSRGLFQQRANGAWGSLSDRMDPFASATYFFKSEAKVKDRGKMTPTAVAHAVQANANPNFYTPYWAPAVSVVAALSGSTCVAGDTGSGATLPSDQATPSGPHAALIVAAITFAQAQLGKPYVWGGAGPDSWDCSGLTMAAYAAAGIGIGGHNAAAQYQYGSTRGWTHPLAEAQPGDLIFWGGIDPYHVAISLGGDWILAAPQPGEDVKVEKVWGTPNPLVVRPVDGVS